MPKFLTCIFLIFGLFTGNAASIDKAYAALHEYDYFKAKKIFYTQLKKSRAEAAFGLASIYYRNDNPFYNLDSSYKYIAICRTSFPFKKTSPYVKEDNLNALHDSICTKAYLIFLRRVNIQSAEKYASTFYDSKYLDDVLCKRDSLVFNEIKNSSQSLVVLNYINFYPQSCYLQNAQQLLSYNLYRETVTAKNDSAYLRYIRQYPHTKYTQQAKEELLEYYIRNKDASGIYYYIKKINPSSYAWNALFSNEIKNYSEKNVKSFLEKYPDYPDRKQLEEEFKYWQMPFFSIKHHDKYGFADSTGKVCIEPVYAEAEDFKEGFSVVEKNSLYGYINKAGRIKIDFLFDEAGPFIQQVAIVQKNKAVFLIDHTGKKLSDDYDEIADFSDNTAIVKKNNLYGAINHNGEEIIKPSFSYLSDFSENMASFAQNNKYGFINKQGFTVVAPLYNWISSFKNNRCRVKTNNRFGVIDKKGDFVLEPLYDFIDEPFKGIYVAVKNNLYGFIDTSGCFLSEIKYNYNPALKIADLTNGTFMRLIKNNKEELQDKNGIKYFSQQNFTQIQLTEGDIIAGSKKNKIQFYQVNKIAPIKSVYNQVKADGNYWYAHNDKGCSVFTLNLKEKLFTAKTDNVKPLNESFFSYENDEGTGIMNKEGVVLLEAFFDEITPTPVPNIFYIIRKEKGAYYNVNTLKFIWQEPGFNPVYIADEE
jgi:hypothetical protein